LLLSRVMKASLAHQTRGCKKKAVFSGSYRLVLGCCTEEFGTSAMQATLRPPQAA